MTTPTGISAVETPAKLANLTQHQVTDKAQNSPIKSLTGEDLRIWLLQIDF